MASPRKRLQKKQERNRAPKTQAPGSQPLNHAGLFPHVAFMQHNQQDKPEQEETTIECRKVEIEKQKKDRKELLKAHPGLLKYTDISGYFHFCYLHFEKLKNEHIQNFIDYWYKEKDTSSLFDTCHSLFYFGAAYFQQAKNAANLEEKRNFLEQAKYCIQSIKNNPTNKDFFYNGYQQQLAEEDYSKFLDWDGYIEIYPESLEREMLLFEGELYEQEANIALHKHQGTKSCQLYQKALQCYEAASFIDNEKHERSDPRLSKQAFFSTVRVLENLKRFASKEEKKTITEKIKVALFNQINCMIKYQGQLSSAEKEDLEYAFVRLIKIYKKQDTLAKSMELCNFIIGLFPYRLKTPSLLGYAERSQCYFREKNYLQALSDYCTVAELVSKETQKENEVSFFEVNKSNDFLGECFCNKLRNLEESLLSISQCELVTCLNALQDSDTTNKTLATISKESLFLTIKNVKNDQQRAQIFLQCLDQKTALGKRFWTTEQRGFSIFGNSLASCALNSGYLEKIVAELKKIEAVFLEAEACMPGPALSLKSEDDKTVGDALKTFTGNSDLYRYGEVGKFIKTFKF